MGIIIFVFIFAFVYKFAKNAYAFHRTKSLKDKYISWLKKQDCPDFPTYRSECIRLMKDAGVEDKNIPVSQSLGNYQVANFSASAIANFPSRIESQCALAIGMLSDAIGEYRRRMFETFNPLYWIDAVLFAPKNLLSYLNIPSQNLTYKILNSLLTALWWCACVLFAIYGTAIKDAAINLLQNM